MDGSRGRGQALNGSQTADAERRFGGIDRLYGRGSLARLARAHACVVGIGGVGSWVAEALARSGVGQVTLIDLDHVAESNVNRQVQAMSGTLGAAKVLAMKERVVAINPECVVATIEDFVTEENVAALVPGCDVLVDAIDQVRAKAALIAHCRRTGIPVITTGGAGGRSDPARLRVDDLARTTQDALASKVRARLRKEFGFTREPKKKFGVPCIFSDESIRRPVGADSCDIDDHAQGLHGLNCAGYGSSVCVTAAFGLAAASQAIGILLK